MFTANFASEVIAPAAQGQPIFVSGVMHFFIRIFLVHPAVCNSLVALIQMALGVLILWKRTAKYGLIGSAVWALFVWYVGEGLGGLLSGQTSLLMGAPGGALLYAVIALAVIPLRTTDQEKAIRPAGWLAIAWAVLWLGGAIYQLLPGQNTTNATSSMIIAMANGAPGWLASLDLRTANMIHNIGAPNSGFGFILLLATVQAFIGIAIFLPGFARKLAISAGIILSLAFWIIGQGLGGYYTGLATDPNTGPLVILLGIAILGLGNEIKLALLG
jgi:hypothetical protein